MRTDTGSNDYPPELTSTVFYLFLPPFIFLVKWRSACKLMDLPLAAGFLFMRNIVINVSWQLDSGLQASEELSQSGLHLIHFK